MSMSSVTKAGWIGLVSTLVLISGAAVQSAAADAALGQGTPFADGTVEAGALKATTCSACHGPNGNSTTAVWPKIAGQNAVYIAEQLQLFKTGVRVNPDMLKIVSTLSVTGHRQRGGVLPGPDPGGRRGGCHDGGTPARTCIASAIRRARFRPARPATARSAGAMSVADYPALRAQFADYVAKQLNDFASGARYSGAKPGAPTSRNGYMMTTVAKRLNSEDIKELAAYIQGMR